MTATVAPIPADQHQVTITLSAAPDAARNSATLLITGTTTVGGQAVTRFVPAIALRVIPSFWSAATRHRFQWSNAPSA